MFYLNYLKSIVHVWSGSKSIPVSDLSWGFIMIAWVSAIGVPWSINIIIISWSMIERGILWKIMSKLISSVSILEVSELRSVLVFIKLVSECVLISLMSTI